MAHYSEVCLMLQKRRFALLSLRVFIPLFQLMFPGFALWEVRIFRSEKLVLRWQALLWFLPQWNDGWLMVISGWSNITDSPDQFFPPAGAQQRPFSQDRRSSLIGSYLDIVIMHASHSSLLWLGETQLNLYLISLLHRGGHWVVRRAQKHHACLRQHGWPGSRCRAWIGVWQAPSPPPATEEIVFWKLCHVLQ